MDDKDFSILDNNDVSEVNAGIISIFKNMDGVTEFSSGSDGSDFLEMDNFSFVFSSVKFRVNIISTVIFSLVRITNNFDFSATKEFENIDVLRGANKFNACAIGIKALIPKKNGKYVDFCADIITKHGDLKVPDIQLKLMILSGSPMNFLAVNKD